MADGLAVLVTPDRGLRRGPRRPGRDGGLYAFIRRVIASGAIVVVVYGLTWVAGVMGALGAFFNTPALVEAAEVSRLIVPIDGLWRGAVYSLEPAAMITLFRAAGSAGRSASANPFFEANGPPLTYVGWVVGWIVVVLALTIYSFRRREI